MVVVVVSSVVVATGSVVVVSASIVVVVAGSELVVADELVVSVVEPPSPPHAAVMIDMTMITRLMGLSFLLGSSVERSNLSNHATRRSVRGTGRTCSWRSRPSGC